jgi:hypothetical protein
LSLDSGARVSLCEGFNKSEGFAQAISLTKKMQTIATTIALDSAL